MGNLGGAYHPDKDPARQRAQHIPQLDCSHKDALLARSQLQSTIEAYRKVRSAWALYHR